MKFVPAAQPASLRLPVPVHVFFYFLPSHAANGRPQVSRLPPKQTQGSKPTCTAGDVSYYLRIF
jgi:hypothetical protein